MLALTLRWGTSAFHYPRSSFLEAQMISMVFFALGIPVSARMADRLGRGQVLLFATACICLFGIFFSQLFRPDNWSLTVVFQSAGMLFMGLTYGPLGTALAEIFPVRVRYTGASLSFTLAGILGASLAPYLATQLATRYSLAYVGYYLALTSLLTILALLFTKKAMQDPEAAIK